MELKPTFRRVSKPYPMPVTPLKRLKNASGKCLVCGNEVKGVDVHTGVCNLLVNMYGEYKGGQLVITDKGKSLLEAISKKHL